MQERKIKQIDILNLTKPFCKKYDVKFNKSDLSQYISGKTEPNQDKLVVLSMALNVNEAWLMGFDVPMEKVILTDNILENNSESQYFLSSSEIFIIEKYRSLNGEGQEKINDHFDYIISKHEYKKHNQAILGNQKNG